MTEDSPQRLNPTFYSARIKYPEKKEGDKYAAIASYLKKAAAAKADKHNQLDRVFSFNGASYNSDCLIVWMDDEKAYMENFPLAFGTSNGIQTLELPNETPYEILSYSANCNERTLTYLCFMNMECQQGSLLMMNWHALISIIVIKC